MSTNNYVYFSILKLIYNFFSHFKIFKSCKFLYKNWKFFKTIFKGLIVLSS